MEDFSKLFKTADWKLEKHVPAIDLPSELEKGEGLPVKVSVGKAVPHPNTTEHHIAWIDVYFLAEGKTALTHLGRFEFLSHGASTDGPNTSSIYTSPDVTCTFETGVSGTIIAFSYCNIHGLWTNSEELKIK